MGAGAANRSSCCMSSDPPGVAGLWRRRHREITMMAAAVMAVVASLASGTTMNWVDGLFYRPVAGHQRGETRHSGRAGRGDRDGPQQPRLGRARSHATRPLWAVLGKGDRRAGRGPSEGDRLRHHFQLFGQSISRRSTHNTTAGSTTHWPAIMTGSCWPARPDMPVAAPVEAAVYDLDGDAGKDEPAAIAFAELNPDSDGVQRRVGPHLSRSDGHLLPTFAAALLARAQAPAMPDPVLLAPAAPLEAIPTYRLIDVLRCLDQRSAAIAAGIFRQSRPDRQQPSRRRPQAHARPVHGQPPARLGGKRRLQARPSRCLACRRRHDSRAFLSMPRQCSRC